MASPNEEAMNSPIAIPAPFENRSPALSCGRLEKQQRRACEWKNPLVDSVAKFHIFLNPEHLAQTACDLMISVAPLGDAELQRQTLRQTPEFGFDVGELIPRKQLFNFTATLSGLQTRFPLPACALLVCCGSLACPLRSTLWYQRRGIRQ